MIWAKEKKRLKLMSKKIKYSEIYPTASYGNRFSESMWRQGQGLCVYVCVCVCVCFRFVFSISIDDRFLLLSKIKQEITICNQNLILTKRWCGRNTFAMLENGSVEQSEVC